MQRPLHRLLLQVQLLRVDARDVCVGGAADVEAVHGYERGWRGLVRGGDGGQLDEPDCAGGGGPGGAEKGLGFAVYRCEGGGCLVGLEEEGGFLEKKDM